LTWITFFFLSDIAQPLHFYHMIDSSLCTIYSIGIDNCPFFYIVHGKYFKEIQSTNEPIVICSFRIRTIKYKNTPCNVCPHYLINRTYSNRDNTSYFLSERRYHSWVVIKDTEGTIVFVIF